MVDEGLESLQDEVIQFSEALLGVADLEIILPGSVLLINHRDDDPE